MAALGGSAAALTLTLVLMLGTAAALARGWSRPLTIAPPSPLQIAGTHVAFENTGQSAVGFARVDPDHAAGSQAWVTVLSAGGRPGPLRRIPGARQVLDMAFLDGALRVLIGAGGGTQCCATARELTLGGRGPQAQHTLTRSMVGTVFGALLGTGRGMLVALGDAAQLRVLQARTGERFGPVRRLTPAGATPLSLLASQLPGARTLLAWVGGSFRPQDTPAPETIMLATGTSSQVPGQARALLTLPAGHSASQLALAAGPRASLAWIEDFTDDTGAYQSEVSVAGLGSSGTPTGSAGPPGTAVSFSAPGTVQSGLSAAADAAGDQLLAWSSCDSTAACQVMAVTRTAQGTFGTPTVIGAIDAGAAPAVALTTAGAGAVGWISAGHATIAYRGSAGGAFAYRSFAGAGDAEDLTLAAGPRGRMLAAWSDGSPRQSLELSLYLP